jgi:hypothetical protein
MRTAGTPRVGLACSRRVDVVKDRWILRRGGQARDTNPFASRSLFYRSGLWSGRTQDTLASDKVGNPKLAQKKGEPFDEVRAGSGAPSAVEAVNHGLDVALAEGLYLEATLFAGCCSTEDKNEGTRAFL